MRFSACIRTLTAAKFTLAAVLLLVVSASAFSKTLEFYGDAYDLDTNELLYREIHQLTLSSDGTPISETVEYQSANGDVLGFKQLDYQSLTAPNYSANYKYLDVAESVELRTPSILINRGGSTTLDKPNTLFSIDGGFHYLMLENFQQLNAKQTLKFDFLSAGRGSFIGLKAKPSTKGDDLTIELSLDNFILSKLVKPIELTYDTATRQLLSYKGLTNLPSANGKLYSAEIKYSYPVETAQALIAFQTGG